jgi:hypothetical protein
MPLLSHDRTEVEYEFVEIFIKKSYYIPADRRGTGELAKFSPPPPAYGRLQRILTISQN